MPRPLTALARVAFLLLAAGAASAQPSTLQINYAGGGVTSADVANCVKGGYVFGDTRSCDGSTGAVAAHAGDTLSGWGWATFANGISTQARGVAAFGTLGAFALSEVPNTVNAPRNTQSRGAATMHDVISATNTSGATSTTYQYTVIVNGSLSPLIGFVGVTPYAYASVSTGLSFSPNCFDCNTVSSNWNSVSGQPANNVRTGSFTVLAGVSFQMSASDVISYINTAPFQSATAQADYGSTMHVYLDAATPGGNTVGASGFNYASAVPEPSSSMLLLLGTAAVVAMRVRRDRPGPIQPGELGLHRRPTRRV